MTFRRRLAVPASAVASLLVLLCASGRGARASEPEQFRAFVASDFHRGLIAHALEGIPPAVFRTCPSLRPARSLVSVLVPVGFGVDGFPNAGSWKEAFPVAGCGNDTIINLHFTARANEKIDTLVLAPGTTRGDAVLQNDALRSATIGARTAVPSCGHFDVRTTRFEQFGSLDGKGQDPGPGASRRPWWETWAMVGCDQVVEVPLAFVPDATGTAVIARMASRKP